jgi:polyketide cyclase/dehydrase/lipid transport protein
MGVEMVTPGDNGGVGLGAIFRVTIKLAGRPREVDYRITRYERPACVVLDASDPAFRSIDTVTITASSDGGSLATYDAVLRPSGLLRILAPLVAVAFARIGRAAAQGLARELGQ